MGALDQLGGVLVLQPAAEGLHATRLAHEVLVGPVAHHQLAQRARGVRAHALALVREQVDDNGNTARLAHGLAVAREKPQT